MSSLSILPALAPLGVQAAQGVAKATKGGVDFLSYLLAPAATATPQVPPAPESSAVQSFKQSVVQELQRAGIAIGNALTLSSDGLGGVKAETEGSNRYEIEQALNRRPEILKKFQSLLSEAAGAIEPQKYRLTIASGSSIDAQA
jgi:hypothetical protein